MGRLAVGDDDDEEKEEEDDDDDDGLYEAPAMYCEPAWMLFQRLHRPIPRRTLFSSPLKRTKRSVQWEISVSDGGEVRPLRGGGGKVRAPTPAALYGDGDGEESSDSDTGATVVID
jgi:hypothetical protein